jgi:hypothetical protein
MTISQVVALSYQVYLGQAFAVLFLPWLILVLWRRWLPRWPQTLLVAAITLALMPPIYGVTAFLSGAVHNDAVTWVGMLLVSAVIWSLREVKSADAAQPAAAPDARWKLLLAFLGSFGAIVAISVALDATPRDTTPNLALQVVPEVPGPTYEADFKQAMEARDPWAAYAAYREAARYRDTGRLRPVIDLYAELRDPTGLGLKALVARKEGREAERLDYQDRAAKAGDPLGMVLVLESARGNHDSKKLRLANLSEEERAYSDKLFLAQEFTEVVMRCLYMTVPNNEAMPSGCAVMKSSDFKPTALIELDWGEIGISYPDRQITVPMTPAKVFGLFNYFDDKYREATIENIPAVASGYPAFIRATQWSPDLVVTRPGYLVDNLSIGVRFEDPESGLLLHEASFISPYRDIITPEEALAGLQMAANWGHPVAMKRLSALYEHGVGGVEANPTLALALLVGRDRYKEASDPDALDDANRIAATLTPKQIEMANFSAKTWRPGGLLVLFDPEKWQTSE